MKIIDRTKTVVNILRLYTQNQLGRPVSVKIDGVSYYLNPEPAALYHALHSVPKLERMVELVADARTIFGVGANCGIFAALCAQKFPSAAIHAFEPAKALQPILARNCPAESISVHQLAVGERNEDVTLFVNPDSQQTNSLKPSAVQAFADSADIEMETIRCVTLDSFVAEYKSGPIDVLKIDVQGLEGAVLRGARTALETVEYLFIEVTWLDLEGVQRVLPTAEHYGFQHGTVVNPVHTGADLLFTREPLTADMPNLLRFRLGAESEVA